jgi:hypothetical protein
MHQSRNPWLDLPLEDYEFHMAEVGQLSALSELFGEALTLCRPRSVALLGAAGGNGLERIDLAVTERVVAVDVNDGYLTTLRRRFGYLHGLEVLATDLATETIDCAPVELVHAGLVFEHAGVERCLDNALRMKAPGGKLSVVLQEPGLWDRKIGGRPHGSLRGIAHFEFLEPGRFRGILEMRGMSQVHEKRYPVPGGWFWLGIFT